MTDEHRIATYVALVVGGARFEDERLDSLRRTMTAAELAAAGRRLGAEYLKTLPPLPTDSSPGSNGTELDCADLYIALVRRGARPDDVRLAALGNVMTEAELERCRAAISTLWLQAQLSGRPN
jgi:hypothetical protein